MTTGLGLTAYVILTLLTILTLIKLNTVQLWQHFFPQPAPRLGMPLTGVLRFCLNCRFTGLPDARGRCPRCHTPLRHRWRHSLQKAWAALIAAIIMLIPANMLPISIIYLNGNRNQDTIMSGILSLRREMSRWRQLFLSPAFWCRLSKLLCYLRCC